MTYPVRSNSEDVNIHPFNVINLLAFIFLNDDFIMQDSPTEAKDQDALEI